MVKIIFVCHGNICRSPMAEFVMRDLCEKKGLSYNFEIASAATSYEEVGNPVHYGTVKKLKQHGISCGGKRARVLTVEDIEYYDLVIAMERYNLRGIDRLLNSKNGLKEACGGKVKLLLDYTPRGGDIADPWYTGNFDDTWDDVLEGCNALLIALEREGKC